MQPLPPGSRNNPTAPPILEALVFLLAVLVALVALVRPAVSDTPSCAAGEPVRVVTPALDEEAMLRDMRLHD